QFVPILAATTRFPPAAPRGDTSTPHCPGRLPSDAGTHAPRHRWHRRCPGRWCVPTPTRPGRHARGRGAAPKPEAVRPPRGLPGTRAWSRPSPGPNDENRNTPGNRGESDDWRERDQVVSLGRCLHRSDIQHFVVRGVTDAAGCEGDDAEHDEEDADQLHFAPSRRNRTQTPNQLRLSTRPTTHLTHATDLTHPTQVTYVTHLTYPIDLTHLAHPTRYL